MNYLIHATLVHPSLCLQYLVLLFTIATITTFILLLLFHYYHHYKTIATDKPLRASLFLGAAELTTYLLRLINILWLLLCRINKFGLYFPRRLLRSHILVGHQAPNGIVTWNLVKTIILNEESRKIADKDGSSSHSEVLETQSRGRSKSRGPKKGERSRSKSKGKYANFVCHHCHEKGHIKWHCEQ
jgi:hypothetical protein